MRFSFLLAALVVLATSGLSFDDATVRSSSPLDHTSATPAEAMSSPANVYQACATDIQTHCDGNMDRVHVCLTQRLNKISSTVCKSWVTARTHCQRDAKLSNKCKKKNGITLRACLQRMSKIEFSDGCYNSQYLKAMLMAKRKP